MKHLTKFKLMLSRVKAIYTMVNENFGSIILVRQTASVYAENLLILNY